MADGRRPFGIILAGGRATRMGSDKALVPFHGRPLIAHVIERLAPQVAGLAINANGDPARLSGFGYAIIPDSIEGFPGPLAGFLAGLDHVASLPDALGPVAFCATDTPFLPVDLVARLMEHMDHQTIVYATSPSGAHPTSALVPATLRDDLRSYLKSASHFSVLAWMSRHPTLAVAFDIQDGIDPFLNLNSPDDLARAANLRGL